MSETILQKVPVGEKVGIAFSGGLDTIIGEESSVYIAKAGKGHNRHVSIPGCTHYMFYDKDKSAENEAVKAVLDWFSP